MKNSKNKWKKIDAINAINDIDFWVNFVDEKIESFNEKDSYKKDENYEELNKEDFIFVMKNKINKIKELLEMKLKNEE